MPPCHCKNKMCIRDRCYYRALQDGPASIVVPVDKLSIVVTIGFSYILLKEKLSRKAGVGLLLILLGTGVMLL